MAQAEYKIDLPVFNGLLDVEIAEGRGASAGMPPILRYFGYTHLPPGLQKISKVFADAATEMIIQTAASPEQTAGLRKLLEAKDCFVRAALPQAELEEQPTEPV